MSFDGDVLFLFSISFLRKFLVVLVRKFAIASQPSSPVNVRIYRQELATLLSKVPDRYQLAVIPIATFIAVRTEDIKPIIPPAK